MTLTHFRGFRLEVPDEPGALHEVTQRLAKENVNILGICGLTVGGRGEGMLAVNDAEAAQGVLSDAGITFREVPLLLVELADRPGQLDRYLQGLAAEGVNVRAIFSMPSPYDTPAVAFYVDDAERAERILSQA